MQNDPQVHFEGNKISSYLKMLPTWTVLCSCLKLSIPSEFCTSVYMTSNTCLAKGGMTKVPGKKRAVSKAKERVLIKWF